MGREPPQHDTQLTSQKRTLKLSKRAAFNRSGHGVQGPALWARLWLGHGYSKLGCPFLRGHRQVSSHLEWLFINSVTCPLVTPDLGLPACLCLCFPCFLKGCPHIQTYLLISCCTLGIGETRKIQSRHGSYLPRALVCPENFYSFLRTLL